MLLLGPWSVPTADGAAATIAVARSILSGVVTLVLIAMTLAALLLARHNVRAKRADRRGAARLAMFVHGGLRAVVFLIAAHHVPDVSAEMNCSCGTSARCWWTPATVVGDLSRARTVRAPLLARRHSRLDAAGVGLRARSARRPRSADRLASSSSIMGLCGAVFDQLPAALGYPPPTPVAQTMEALSVPGRHAGPDFRRTARTACSSRCSSCSAT